MSHSATASIVIHAPRERVWQALTEPTQVKAYFFGTDLETSWRPGAPLFFRGEWEGKRYEDRGRVLSFAPPQSLSYDYWSSFSGLEDKPELRQIVSYDLAEADGGTRVRIQQSNVDTKERAEHSQQNWRGVLDALKKYVEGAE